jgi:hypothetical protein
LYLRARWGNLAKNKTGWGAMAKRIILHIGMPKTGTTSLQRAFFSSTQILRARGIAYAIEGLQRGIGHHDLIEAVAERNAKVVDRYFEEAKARHDAAEQILISSEGMCKLRGDELIWWRDCLNRHFGNPDFAIWLFARRQSALIPSQWHGYIRRGGRQNLPGFALDAVNRLLSANRLPLQAAFERYASIFGSACMNVVPMEKLLAQDGDLVAGAFSRMFGLEGEQVRGLPPRNTALEPGEAELLRALAMRYAQEDAAGVGKFAWRLIPLLQKGDNVFSDLARMFDPYAEQLTIEDRSETFLLLEREAIDRLGDRLEAWGDGSIFGPQDPKPAPYIRDEYWFDDKIRQRLDQAYSMAAALPERAGRKIAKIRRFR